MAIYGNGMCISPVKAKGLLNDRKWKILDVREHREWNAGHIPNAIHVALSQLAFHSFGQFDKNQPFLVLCHSGSRSSFVVERLRKLGFTHVHNLSGGLVALNEHLDKKIGFNH